MARELHFRLMRIPRIILRHIGALVFIILVSMVPIAYFFHSTRITILVGSLVIPILAHFMLYVTGKISFTSLNKFRKILILPFVIIIDLIYASQIAFFITGNFAGLNTAFMAIVVALVPIIISTLVITIKMFKMNSQRSSESLI